MNLVKWAKKKAAKRNKSSFKFCQSEGVLDIAVVCETGEWFVWKAKVIDEKSGDGEGE